MSSFSSPFCFFFLIRSWVNLERTKLLYKTATLHLPGVEEAKLFAEFNPNSRSSLNYPHTVILECGELSACQNVSHLPGAALHHFGRLQKGEMYRAAPGNSLHKFSPSPSPNAKPVAIASEELAAQPSKRSGKLSQTRWEKKKKNSPPKVENDLK